MIQHIKILSCFPVHHVTTPTDDTTHQNTVMFSCIPRHYSHYTSKYCHIPRHYTQKRDCRWVPFSQSSQIWTARVCSIDLNDLVARCPVVLIPYYGSKAPPSTPDRPEETRLFTAP
ncbi:hypothetical protein BaRGS_00000207 [Batillaria attramentaria]|uniref:Uncharacterized protein n=1 Tax=Batillaria attramentaria TaxID=370345 RepID=A0ABD0MC00_9CAEN